MIFVGHQESLNVGQNGILVKVVANDRGYVSVNGLVVGNSGTDGIGQAHVAGAISVEKSGHAENGIAAEAQRVDENRRRRGDR